MKRRRPATSLGNGYSASWVVRTQVFSAGVLVSLASAVPADPLPVPCAGGTCGGSVFVSSGNAGYTVNGSIGTVTQHTDRAILNWREFNIDPGHTVNFQQPSAESAALNRIFQNDASRILGSLNANGQVYLINQNGILFGQGAQVNVGSLTASSLNIKENIFNDVGIVNAINQSSDEDRPAFKVFEETGPDGQIQILEGGPIQIREGAQIRTAEGGRVLIVAPDISNEGRISTPGGQSILAAGSDRVYLMAAPTGNDVRGLLVEVNTGGSVSNLGQIVAERGNVTMLGLAVNQSGTVRATTSVNLNGSVHLLARDTVPQITQGAGANEARPTHFGTVTLGAGSRTEVMPDVKDQSTAIDEQQQLRSAVLMNGRDIQLRGGAEVIAPNGRVTITGTVGQTNDPARVLLESGSRIDVSGTEDVVLPMSRNFVEVELRGNELRDAPLQRDGELRNQRVTVDVRRGTPLADVSGAIAGIRRGVGERTTVGGDVNISSAGEVQFQQGAMVDISGGAVTFLPGSDQSSVLMSQGQLINIADADPNVIYDGLFGVHQTVHQRWGVVETFATPGSFMPGYVEGKDAGSLSISAQSMQFDGDVLAATTRGLHQRYPSQSLPSDAAAWTRAYQQVPLGGLLSVESILGSQQDIVLRSRASTNAVEPDALIVPLEALRAGVTRTEFISRGDILLPQGERLELDAGGELTLIASGAADIGGEIVVPAGTVEIDGRAQGGGASEIVLRDGARIDARGQWVNDALDEPGRSTAPLFVDGGSVTLVANVNDQASLALETGSVIDVSGGAWVKEGGDLEAGAGGDITVGAQRPNNSEVEQNIRIDGAMRSHALEQGGELTILAGSIAVTSSRASASQLTLSPEFFSTGGFSSYNLQAQDGDILIASGTQLTPRAANLQVLGDPTSQVTGTDLYTFSQIEMLSDLERQPVDLAFTVKRPYEGDSGPLARIELAEGASINADPGSNISFTSDGNIHLLGLIYAPAGAISARISAPSGGLQQGFLPEQGIWIGEHARLATPAAARIALGPADLRAGEVLDGGSVTLQADRGYIVAESGSTIDVSGAAATIDVLNGTGYEATQVAGSAGRISLTAAEGILVNSELRAHAADVPGAAGGTLEFRLTTIGRGTSGTAGEVNAPFFDPASMSPLRTISLRDGPAPIVAFGQPVSSSLNGLAVVNTTAVDQGGFDTVTLHARPVNGDNNTTWNGSRGRIEFDGDVSLNAARQIVLDAPVLASGGESASVNAPYVAIGMRSHDFRAASAPTAGTGTLHVNAQLIDLVGDVALQGFGNELGAEPGVVLSSSGDIRLRGVEIPNNSAALSGSFAVADDVLFRSSQLYTTTLSDYTIWARGEESRIIIEGNGTASPTPLSAASTLTLAAVNIEQRGTVKAPFGEIRLGNFTANNAGQRGDFVDATSIVLGAGSVTSVSGEDVLVPLGQVQFDREWVYGLGSENAIFNRPPDKLVSLAGDSVITEAGSVIDVSGGGDLYAQEFLPGPGGSSDILSSALNGGSFAIVPSLGSQFAPYDPIESLDPDIAVGDQVYLSGMGGLAAGYYAVLPARYALLPGAYLVTPTSLSDFHPSQNARELDGSMIVSGYGAVAGTDIRDSRSVGFRVQSGDIVRRRAEFAETKASDFFANAPGTSPMPNDAGRLQIGATRELVFGGAVAAAGVNGGRGAQLDIAASEIAVVATRSTTPGTAVEIVATELNALGAESVALGALRSSTEDGMELDVRAQSVVVAEGAILRGPEVILVAGDGVTLQSGSALEASASAIPEGFAYEASDNSARALGAFARVSNGSQASIETAATTTGRTTIEAGAAVRSNGSITLAASGDTVSQGSIGMQGGSLSLGASLISIGDTGNGTMQGLLLSESDLAQLTVDELILDSRSTVDLYGDLNLRLSSLVVDAHSVRGFQSAGQRAAISADEVVLGNSRATTPAAHTSGAGELQLSAQQIEFAEGQYSITGFGAVALDANVILGSGEGNVRIDGDLAARSSLITATAGATTTFDISDVARFTSAAVPAAKTAEDALGASFAVAADAIEFGGHIRLASGIVDLRSRGAGGLTMAPAAGGAAPVIDVSGRDRVFDDVSVGSPGGSISLVAETGSLAIDGAAYLDVSAGQSGGAAGQVSLRVPNGALQLASTVELVGRAGIGQQGGSIDVDAGSLSGVSVGALAGMANTGGFAEAFDLRLRNGSIDIAAADVVRAHEIELTADTGSMQVAGILDASGPRAGRIELNAAGDIVIDGSGRLVADATDADEVGGRVELTTSSGTIDIRPTVARSGESAPASASVAGTRVLVDGVGDPLLDANGDPLRDHGRVYLRAPRSASNDQVAIAGLGGTIANARQVTIEGARIYDTYQAAPISVIDDGLIATIAADTEAFQQNDDAILASLGVSDDARYEVAPGLEIRSSGSLMLLSPWDLLSLHMDQTVDLTTGLTTVSERAAPGTLTLRAVGDLNVSASLSDGFYRSLDPDASVSREYLIDGRSYGLRLIGGADLASADVTAVTHGAGDVVVGSNVTARTGTGDVDLAAGRDIRMTDTTSAIYSAGRSSGIGTMPPILASFFLPGAYPQDGGSIRIRAEGSIHGPANGHMDQLITQWLHRTGGPVTNPVAFDDFPTAWAVQLTDPFNPDASLFRQNVGSFGGGNVTVSAAGDIENFSVVLPTTGQQVGDVEFNAADLSLVVSSNEVLVRGGGDLDMRAGGDILGGLYYLGRGEGKLSAGGSITAIDSAAGTGHPALALADAQITLQAREVVTMQAAFNPTVLMKSFVGTQGGEGSYFFTYSDDSAIHLESIAGDVRVLNDAISNDVVTGAPSISQLVGVGADVLDGFKFGPATFSATATEGSIVFAPPAGSLTLDTFPSASGGVRLLANQDVRIEGQRATLTISDADRNLLPTVQRPLISNLGAAFVANVHAATPVHTTDLEPSVIVARNGFIGATDALSALTLDSAESVRVRAALDVFNFTLAAQHVRATDVSIVKAGRDIAYPLNRSLLPPGTAPADTAIREYRGTFQPAPGFLEVAGPGELQILAGRHMDLGTAEGIKTSGDIRNPVLQDDGANLLLIAGLATPAEHDAFITKYFEGSSEYRDELQAYLASTGAAAGSDPVATFRALPQERQRKLLLDILFAEVRAAGTAAATGTSAEYQRGFDAIETYFPEDNNYSGDMSLILSQVATLDGGNIRMLTPGGSINAGVATTDALAKRASELGIVAQRAGDIDVLLKGDLLVNQSRVFALDGGSITVWSSEGDIDAGRGAKTAISAPPPTVSFDAEGNVVIEFPPAISGSGIRGAVATPGRKPGNVYLFAPAGVVDAGDAGIGSAGDVVIAATEVLGADNIDVGGIAVGIPVETSGLAAGLTNASATASSATNSATGGVDSGGQDSAAPIAEGALSWLEVFVVGLGEEGCKQDDIACLKRQHTPD